MSQKSRSPREVLSAYHQAMKDKAADDLAALYAEDAVHEFGFYTPNRSQRLEGRESVRAAYRDGWRATPLTLDAIEDVFTYDATDPEVVFGQFRAHGSVSVTGKPVEITGLLVLRVRDGLIVHTRDFVDALGVASALGRNTV